MPDPTRIHSLGVAVIEAINQDIEKNGEIDLQSIGEAMTAAWETMQAYYSDKFRRQSETH